MGGLVYPVLGFLGVMFVKNIVVNILIFMIFMSFFFYRWTGKVVTVVWAKTGYAVQLMIFAFFGYNESYVGEVGLFVFKQ